MSSSISEILQPFKKLAVVYNQVQKSSALPRIFTPDNTLLLTFETVHKYHHHHQQQQKQQQ